MENLFNPDGTFIPGYAEKLDPTFKDNPTLANTKDLKSMASQLLNAESLAGKKVEALIPTDAKPEQIVSFLRKFMKAPDKAEAYKEITKPADWPETIPWNEEVVKGFAGILPEIGILPWQAKRLFDWYNGVSRKFHEDVAAAGDAMNAEAEKKLKDKHKNNYEKVSQAANAVLNKYASPDFGADTAAKYANDPFIIDLLGNIAGKMGEDFIRLPGGGPSATAITEAQAKISKIMGDKAHAYFHKENPAHDAATEEVKKLYEILYPEPAIA